MQTIKKSTQVQQIENALRTEPEFVLELALANNPAAIQSRLEYFYGIRSTQDPDDLREAIVSATKAAPLESHQDVILNVLSVPVIPEGLTEETRTAIFNTPAARVITMPVQNNLDIADNSFDVDSYGLPEGTFGSPGTTDDSGFDWAGLATTLIPGILEGLGLGVGSSGAAPSAGAPSSGGGTPQPPADNRKDNSVMSYVLYGFLGLIVLLIAFFVFRAVSNKG